MTHEEFELLEPAQQDLISSLATWFHSNCRDDPKFESECGCVDAAVDALSALGLLKEPAVKA